VTVSAIAGPVMGLAAAGAARPAALFGPWGERLLGLATALIVGYAAYSLVAALIRLMAGRRP
jgi:hypothetical protein